MKTRFTLAPGQVIECRWSAFSGLERYYHNGREVLRKRSFAISGQRVLNIAMADGIRRVVIDVHFRPTLKTLWRSNGLAISVSVDGKLIIPDLLDRQYRIVSSAERVSVALFGVATIAILLVLVDPFIFNSAVLKLPRASVSPTVEIINAALATEECLDALDSYEQSMMLRRSQAMELRRREMQRTSDWRIDEENTVLSAAHKVHWGVNSVCRHAVRELLSQYIDNGANVDERFGFSQMTLLESAITSSEGDLVCLLLKKGASLSEAVIMRRGDGTPSLASGLNPLQLAWFYVEKRKTAADRHIVDLIENYIQTGECP